MDARVAVFLKGEDLAPEEAKRRGAKVAWYGFSDKKDKDVIKELCAEPINDKKQTMYDPDRRLWGTLSLRNVINLLLSNLWSPVGVPDSLKESLVTEAKRIVDAEEAAVAKKRAEAAAKEATERANHAAAAREKELLRKKREEGIRELNEDDFEFAWKHYGLERDVLIASKHFPFLGPHPSDPMIRIHRWFRFPHNRSRGAETVVKEDFLPAYKNFLNKEPATTQRTNTKRSRTTEPITLERQRQAQQARVQELKQKQEDKHEAALAAIIEKSKTVPIPSAPYIRACPTCNVSPTEQFLDCWCHGVRWEVCHVCNSTWSKDRVACLC